MSSLKENLQLYWKGVKHFDKVYEGYMNEVKMKSGDLPAEEVEVITDRRLVCAGCPFNSTNAKQLPEYKELTGEVYISGQTELHCSLCSCPIHRKSSCLSCTCGIDEWNKNNSDKKLEPKWGPYESKSK